MDKYISHIFIYVEDFFPTLNFYSNIMDELGLELKFSEAEKLWACWSGSNSPAIFLIGKLHYRKKFNISNQQVISLLAPSREFVDRVYAKALSIGGACNGPPSFRLYSTDYYGASFFDSDGNKVFIFCNKDNNILAPIFRTIA